MGKHKMPIFVHVEFGVLMGHPSEDQCPAGSIP